MPRKWVPNAAERGLDSHEAQNAFCPVKATWLRQRGAAEKSKPARSVGLMRRSPWQIAGDGLIDDFQARIPQVRMQTLHSGHAR
jgi:hypothetical protein